MPATGVSRALLRRALPSSLHGLLRSCRDHALDMRDIMMGRRDPLIPPRRLVFVGNSQDEFRAIGQRWIETFAMDGGIRPSDRVLDVGCGVGRMAVPLARYLNGTGSYEGMDIVASGIEWCKRSITPRFPRFRFQVSDVYNGDYNPAGRVPASEYRFPYSDGEFDFVFLTSVFTHMLPRDTDNYLSEVARVLRPGGRCVITFFLLNEESRTQIASGNVQQGREFRFDLGECMTVDPKKPEIAIAYPEQLVREMYERHSLTILRTCYGGWRRASGARHGQDYFVAMKHPA